MAHQQIFFKKQMLGKWRRSDGESKVHVNEEAMYREIQKLAGDGWHVQIEPPSGVTQVRAIIVTQR